MRTKNHGTVRRLTSNYDNGYAGFGYGGDKLFVTCLVDVFDPPKYFVRADTFEDAYYIAEECLLETVSNEDIAWELNHNGFDPATLEGEALWDAMTECGFTMTESGRTVWAEADIRLDEVTA